MQAPQTERMIALLDRKTRVAREIGELLPRAAGWPLPPASVMATRRVERCSKRVPRSVSSTLTRLLTYAAETDRTSAAPLKLDLRATVQKTRRSSRFGEEVMFIIHASCTVA